MWNPFKKRTIVDDAKDFEPQYRAAQILLFQYLKVWFKQCFADPALSGVGYPDDMNVTMAARVTSYLLGRDKDFISGEIDPEKIEQIKMANRHVEKWGDDSMTKDKEICEFVVQTLRMDGIFKAYYMGTKEYNSSPEGKRVFDLLMKYGGKVPTAPDPNSYTRLIRKWMIWSESAKSKGIL